MTILYIVFSWLIKIYCTAHQWPVAPKYTLSNCGFSVISHFQRCNTSLNHQPSKCPWKLNNTLTITSSLFALMVPWRLFHIHGHFPLLKRLFIAEKCSLDNSNILHTKICIYLFHYKNPFLEPVFLRVYHNNAVSCYSECIWVCLYCCLLFDSAMSQTEISQV